MSEFDLFRMYSTYQNPALSKVEYLPKELFEVCASLVIDKCLCYQSDFEPTFFHSYAQLNIFGEVRELESSGLIVHRSAERPML